MINDSSDIICTRKENGALSLKGYKADIAEQKETINNFIISILQDQFNVPKSLSWSNNSDCEFEIVELNRNSIEQIWACLFYNNQKILIGCIY